MALKSINENPSITDTIVLEITTPGADGCYTANPYKVDNVTIYYIARDYQRMNFGEYERSVYNEKLLAQTETAEALACESPTEENITAAVQLREQLESTKTSNTVIYKERLPQKIIGTPDYPAWLSTDTGNAFITHVTEDDDGNTVYGQFKYEWSPEGDVREGDFIMCWTWTPNPAGESLSAHLHFSLLSDQTLLTTLPIHQTAEDKYQTILERYLPEMYKETLCEGDLTPDTTEKLNLAVAKGFTALEDLANQLIDLFDANVLHQSLLVYLSNLFATKLKSHDQTLWRRQIKKAVPLYKKKGTLSGLEEAFAQAGMQLNQFTQFWQVVSLYTWQESFKVSDSVVFKLEKEIITPVDTDNFRLYLREAGSDTYTELDSSYVSFHEEDCTYFMTWVGEDLSANPITLVEGDIVRVLYQYKEVPGSLEQQVEDYIQTLPLADLRDEEDQIYPPKNWNVRLIEEDDVMFDVIIPVRHPFQNLLIFGQVRTEFPYSENIYNMEEYNGCVVSSTLITTCDNIVCIGDRVGEPLNLLTEHGFRQCEEVTSHGLRKTVVIDTKMGRSLTVTPNHKFKVMTHDGVVWRRADELKTGDYLLGKRGNPNLPISRGVDADTWYAAGLVYGDGWLYGQRMTLLIPESEPATKEWFENYLSNEQAKFNIFEVTPEKHDLHVDMKCNETIWRVSTSRGQAVTLGQLLPPHQPKGHWKQHVPHQLWSSGEEQICAFIRGLFDTDGGVQKKSVLFTSKWRTLCQEVQMLLLQLGILSSVTKYKVLWNGKWMTYWRTRVIGENSIAKYSSKIGFRLERKVEDLIESFNRSSDEILSADRTVIPFACDIIRAIFPKRNCKSKIQPNERGRKEKRILSVITRLKQGYLTVIPDNCATGVLAKALEFGEDCKERDFLMEYVSEGWFFDQVRLVSDGGEHEVFDPVNVEKTRSYLTNGLVSHNSTRDSYDPCFIDRAFRDPCGSCISSKFAVDVGVEEISNERLVEVQEILNEYTPFHAVVHSINFIGELNEFVPSPVEAIESLVLISRSEKVISGNVNPIFHRVIEDGLVDAFKIARNDLAEQSTVLSGLSGTASNRYVGFVAPSVELDDLGVIPWNHVLEILAPHAHAGTYRIDQIYKNTAVINSAIDEPLDQTEFTFRLSNINYSSTSSTITQTNLFKFTDEGLDFVKLNVKSQWDVDNDDDYSGGAWKVDIPAYGGTYTIADVLPDGVIVLTDDGSLPSADASSITYTLLDDDDEEIDDSTSGVLDVALRGLVDLNDTALADTAQVARIGDYASYDGTDYLISSFSGNDFFISDYSEGDVVGADITIQRRLANNEVGFVGYRGLQLATASDHEDGLGILNGNNAPADDNLITDDSNFTENYLFKINDEFYKIAFISGDYVILEGQHQDWTTEDAGGTSVTYDVLHFEKNNIEIKFDVFDEIDRSGHDVVEREIYDQVDETTAITILQDGGSGPTDNVAQEDGISFKIEWSNGETEEGEI